MKLKTFTAPTMAEALAAVRKDFGPDAMILHTRSYRVGSWFGIGGRNMVEITASAGEPASKARKPAVPRRDRLPEFEDDRSAVLSEPTARAQRPPASALSLEPADLVVQRADAVVEPKPTFTEPAAAAAQTPRPEALPVRNGHDANGPARIATRLPRREDRPPVRIADATPPPADPADPAPPRTPPSRHTDLPRFDPEDQPRAERFAGPTPPTPSVAPPPARPAHEPGTNDAPGSDDPAALQAQIADLRKMMGQVLESTRRTSVAMGKVDPRAAESVSAGPLLKYTNQLLDNDAAMETVDAIIGRVRDRLDQAELRDEIVVRQAVLREIEATIDTRSDSLLAISANTTTGRPRVICLVGPTGVGKTTTVAKLAATCKLRHGRRVGLITSDTYRIAAVEQLRTYAGIIGLPIKVVMSPDEMAQAVADLASMDVIIVDTAGRSQHDARRLDELKAFIAAAGPDETHLVLASTVGETVLRRTAERFMALGPDRCILTKLDEAVCTGQLAGLSGRIGLPFSFVTVGQEVPDDIEPARADRLARVALDGPGVICKGSDGRG